MFVGRSRLAALQSGGRVPPAASCRALGDHGVIDCDSILAMGGETSLPSSDSVTSAGASPPLPIEFTIVRCEARSTLIGAVESGTVVVDGLGLENAFQNPRFPLSANQVGSSRGSLLPHAQMVLLLDRSGLVHCHRIATTPALPEDEKDDDDDDSYGFESRSTAAAAANRTASLAKTTSAAERPPNLSLRSCGVLTNSLTRFCASLDQMPTLSSSLAVVAKNDPPLSDSRSTELLVVPRGQMGLPTWLLSVRSDGQVETLPLEHRLSPDCATAAAITPWSASFLSEGGGGGTLPPSFCGSLVAVGGSEGSLFLFDTRVQRRDEGSCLPVAHCKTFFESRFAPPSYRHGLAEAKRQPRKGSHKGAPAVCSVTELPVNGTLLVGSGDGRVALVDLRANSGFASSTGLSMPSARRRSHTLSGGASTVLCASVSTQSCAVTSLVRSEVAAGGGGTFFFSSARGQVGMLSLQELARLSAATVSGNRHQHHSPRQQHQLVSQQHAAPWCSAPWAEPDHACKVVPCSTAAVQRSPWSLPCENAGRSLSTAGGSGSSCRLAVVGIDEVTCAATLRVSTFVSGEYASSTSYVLSDAPRKGSVVSRSRPISIPFSSGSGGGGLVVLPDDTVAVWRPQHPA